MKTEQAPISAGPGIVYSHYENRQVTGEQYVAEHGMNYILAGSLRVAATDQKDQLRYQAGADAVATYAQRLAAGPEAFRQGVAARFA